MDNKEDKNIWFITGASQGFGLYLTQLLLSNGDKVAATTRDVDRLLNNFNEHPEQLLPLKLDVTSDQAVKQAINKTVETLGGLDVLVNNAGYSLVGSMEEMTDKEFRATMDVNLFGPVNVIRHAMPYLREQESGHIINMSSNAGYVGIAKAASYNAAKFGLIGLSEALAQETSDFGIDVTVVAPGQFRTNFMDTIHYVEHRIPAYGVSEDEEAWSEFSGSQPGDPQKLVQILVDITQMEEPPLHLLLGPDTYELVTQKRAKEDREFERWKDLTMSTDFN
jgi:NAD(P)-dependent dehydrogenase (short-subunit alcohol dehydrogenase family)